MLQTCSACPHCAYPMLPAGAVRPDHNCLKVEAPSIKADNACSRGCAHAAPPKYGLKITAVPRDARPRLRACTLKPLILNPKTLNPTS